MLLVRSKAMSPQITKCQSPQRSSALYYQSVAQSPLNLKKPNVDCNRNRKYPQPDIYIKPLSDRTLLVEGDLGASRLGAVDSAKVTATTTAETTAATTATTAASTGTSTATTEAATTTSTALRTRAREVKSHAAGESAVANGGTVLGLEGSLGFLNGAKGDVAKALQVTTLTIRICQYG